jgi:hypothetical protein
MAAKKPGANEKELDELTRDELDERLTLTMHHLDEIRRLWPGMVRLPEIERRSSMGRMLSQLGPQLRLLFDVLLDKDGEEPPIARMFHVLGSLDQGNDPDRFEAALLARRLDRIEVEQKVLDALSDLARHFGDDVLNTGEMVIGPGLLALELARSVSKSNPEFRALLAPALDAFRDMTKNARRRLTEQRSDK